jgi:hypothetical protein
MQFMNNAHAILTVDTTQGTTNTIKIHAFAFMPVTGNKGKDKYELSSSIFDSAVLVYSHLKCDSSQN